MTGMTEMLVYAKAAHLNLEQICQTLQSGAAENFSLDSYGPKILRMSFCSIIDSYIIIIFP